MADITVRDAKMIVSISGRASFERMTDAKTAQRDPWNPLGVPIPNSFRMIVPRFRAPTITA